MTEALYVRLLPLGLLIYATAVAQTQAIRISGRVTDPSGAVVPKACVTLKGAGSAEKTALLTDGKGEFAFAGLAQGTVGLSQVDARITPDVLTGPAVPLYVEVILPDGTVVETNEVTVAIDDTPIQ